MLKLDSRKDSRFQGSSYKKLEDPTQILEETGALSLVLEDVMSSEVWL